MAPSATSDLPQPSPLDKVLSSSLATSKSPHAPYLHHLAQTISHNLEYQHSWTQLMVHTHSPITEAPLPRPLISGLPPKRAYIHPDEQIATLKYEHEKGDGEKVEQVPEREWVLPSQIQENWSLRKFGQVFDAVSVVPEGQEGEGEEGEGEEGEGEEGEGEEGEEDTNVGYQWRGKNRQKRILLATLHDDSTVVYYIMHDGIVKPRQN